MSAFGSVLRQGVEVSCPGDGQEVVVGSVGDGVLPAPRGEVGQGPEVGSPSDLERLGRIRATALAPGPRTASA
jgi:hypothetical protein